MAFAQKAVAIVMTLAVVGLLAAFLAPVAINELEANETTTLDQDSNQTYDVNAKLTSNVTDYETGTTDNATVVLNDTRTTSTTTKTIDNGTTADFSLDGGTVTVGVEQVDDTVTPETGTLNYTYAKDYAYSDGASSVWGLLGLAIVLALVVYLVGLGTNVFDV